jgi:hypothetical protein
MAHQNYYTIPKEALGLKTTGTVNIIKNGNRNYRI